MEIKNEHRLTAVEDLANENKRRIAAVEKRQDDLEDLTSTVKILAVKEQAVENTVNEIKDDVKTLTGKSGKRWDSLVDKAIVTVAGAIIGYILAKIGIVM